MFVDGPSPASLKEQYFNSKAVAPCSVSMFIPFPNSPQLRGWGELGNKAKSTQPLNCGLFGKGMNMEPEEVLEVDSGYWMDRNLVGRGEEHGIKQDSAAVR